MSLYQLTAKELHRKLCNKECSAREVTESVLGRIDACEERVGAYVTLDREGALAAAGEVDKKIAAGEAIGPLAGIPVAVKDNICTKDILTTCSSRMLYNFRPPYDATVVERLRSAGYVMTGKANMDEFAMGSSTETSYFKKTANPHDLARVPGGSSGGSIRQPASLCGVIGLKPTYGSVSRYGLVAFASSLDQIGPFGRCVEDVAALYGVICGKDPMDATTARRDYPDFAAEEYDGLTDMYEKTRSQGFGDEVQRRIMLGTFVLSSGYYDAYYNKAKLFQKALRAEFADAFQDCDLIATPTSPTVAFRLGENTGDPLKMYAADICTVTVNIAGLPGLSVPCGLSQGLPVGMQLIGPRFSEQRLFDAAYGFQTIRGGSLCGIPALA